MAEPTAWFVTITALSFLPFMVVAVTPFVRFIVVFSAIRYALGLQQTPPNIVLISLALIFAFFVMGDVPSGVLNDVLLPMSRSEIDFEQAGTLFSGQIQAWLLNHAELESIENVYAIAGGVAPATPEELELRFLVPAFMLSELAFAFKAAFFIMVPFLLVDLAVSSILMSLGMIMLPPITVSLPIKVMLFVLVDGWTLISSSVAESVLT
jgi:flagellar biosynthetic protein FliP